MSLLVVQLLSGLANAMFLFLIASGLSLIFGVTRIANFAHGSFYMLAAYLTYSLSALLPLGAGAFYAAALLAALLVAGLGGLVEALLLRRVYRAPELYQLLLTFALVLIVADAVRYLWGADNKTGPAAPGLSGSVPIAGQLFPSYDLAVIVFGPLVALGLWALFHRTRWGILIRAATQDREMVAALGVDQSRLFTGVFILGSFLEGEPTVARGGNAAAGGAAVAAADLLGLARGGDLRLRALCGEPAPAHGPGGHGLLRACRVFRDRRLCGRPSPEARGLAHAAGLRGGSRGCGAGRRRLRLFLRPAHEHLLRHAHPRLRPDRLRRRPSMGRGHGRRQRRPLGVASRLA